MLSIAGETRARVKPCEFQTETIPCESDQKGGGRGWDAANCGSGRQTQAHDPARLSARVRFVLRDAFGKRMPIRIFCPHAVSLERKTPRCGRRGVTLFREKNLSAVGG